MDFQSKICSELDRQEEGRSDLNWRKDKLRFYSSGTLFGVTLLAPEHPYVKELVTEECRKDVEEFLDRLQHMSEIERTSTNLEKEGIFIGRYAVNPMNGKEVPIYIANYVLMDYGTGAIMAVPAHDQRDFEFAIKYELDIVPVVDPQNPDIDLYNLKKAFEAEGTMINSGSFNGMNSRDAIKKITAYLEEKGLGNHA